MTANVPRMMRVPQFLGNGIIGFREVAVPTPGVGELLIAVKANALCGSERGQFNEGSAFTPGHESAGIVAAAGAGTNLAVGTPGVVYLMDYCGQCRSCRQGYTNQCLSKKGDYGFNRDGGYAPYMLVSESVFFPIDPDIPLTEATMLLDIMGTGGHAIRRAQLVREDIESIVVAGAGPIGLAVLSMAKLLLGSDLPVFVTDYTHYRLELARQMGAVPVHLGEATLERVLADAGLSGVDAAFDTSGKTAARQTALHMLNARGVLVCIGHGQELHLQVSSDLIAKERAILGSEYFSFGELTDNARLLAENLFYLKQIITHRFGPESLQSAFELFFQGETGKVVIEQ
ncbi:threonine dehydrogenase-like Zn-dependent dehydrogenase [Paenibacillus endophyticus]|uniref:Threonine dehydrogenase-like Zn-dependent dehydrogenase n=1 Tax=Paenibacillus endophyticus TaxID=1294268 RepID=A0A7W5C8K0_9BACL|nr:alcohol dehydrogenase catalytic domain-containing protein [Paenibacillus endophyticus]MBB3153107.1 threonine dehydrogenase-like Zn-dependent dehydrogenase [Paenibacillus endophyticus]